MRFGFNCDLILIQHFWSGNNKSVVLTYKASAAPGGVHMHAYKHAYKGA